MIKQKGFTMFNPSVQLSRRLLASLAALALACPLWAQAQSYPTKPVKVVVGYSAGGAVDAVARTIGALRAGELAAQRSDLPNPRPK